MVVLANIKLIKQLKFFNKKHKFQRNIFTYNKSLYYYNMVNLVSDTRLNKKDSLKNQKNSYIILDINTI